MRIKILLLSTIISVLPVVARDFDYTYEGQTITYTVISEYYKTVETKSRLYDFDHKISGTLVLPSNPICDGVEYTLTQIGDNSFHDSADLTSVTIPNSVTLIDVKAFSGCSGLKSLTIPNSVTTIEGYAFEGCSGLTSLTIPNSVTTIGDHAFTRCTNLTSLTIPSSVTTVGWYAFKDCSSLKQLTLEDGSEYLRLNSYDFKDNPIEKFYLGRNLSYNIEKTGQYNYSKTLTELTIGNSVTSIHEWSFSGCSGLTSLTIPNSVEAIYSNAFKGCTGLTSLTIPSSVTLIDKAAFSSCSSLKQLTLMDGSVSLNLDASALKDSPIEKLYLGRNISNENSAFQETKTLTELTIGNSVTSIYREAFVGCSSLKHLTLADGSENLKFGGYSFKDSPIEKLYLGRNIQFESSPFAFEKTLAELTVSNSVTSFCNWTFGNCTALTSVKYYCTNTISHESWSMSGLPMTLGVNLLPNADGTFKNISKSALTYFQNIQGEINGKRYPILIAPEPLEVKNTIEGENGIYLVDSEAEIKLYLKNDNQCKVTHCGKDVTESFAKGQSFTIIPNANWHLNEFHVYGDATDNVKYRKVNMTAAGNLLNQIGISNIDEIETLKICGDINGTDILTINRMYKLRYLDLSDANIIEGGMEYCTGTKTQQNIVGVNFFKDIALEVFICPNTATQINRLGCSSSINTIEIGANITSIQNGAFSDCIGMTSIIIPNSVMSIGDSAFKGCTNLVSLTIPNSVTAIGDNAFEDCKSLTSAIIPNSVTTISNDAFFGCTALTSVNIPNSVVSIGNDAFFGCTGLTSLIIPNSVTSIGDGAFAKCISLKNLRIEDGTETLTIYGNPVSASAVFDSCPIESFYLGRNFKGKPSWTYGISTKTLKTLTIGNSVTSIEAEAFSGCSSITSLTIPNSVKTIGKSAFSDCSGIISLTISNSATSIGDRAFSGCNSLAKVYSLNTVPPSILSYTFDDSTEATAKLLVPKGSLSSYWLASGWKEWKNLSDDLFCLESIPTATYGDEEINLSKYAPDGEVLSYETSDDDVIEINGSMMRIIGAGSATVRAMLPENGATTEIIGQSRKFTVVPTDLEITVADITIEAGQPLPDLILVANGLVYDDTLSDIEHLPEPICEVDENSMTGEYPVTFTEGYDRNYRISTKDAKVTVVKASSIDGINVDENIIVEVFNLAGMQLYCGPKSELRLDRGIYIVRQGKLTTKVYVK